MRGSLPAVALTCGLVLGLAAMPALASGPRVTLVCAADYYASADSVFFTWTNQTDSVLVAGNHPPYVIYAMSTGEPVCLLQYPSEYSLQPQSSVRLNWDQRDCWGALVPPGPYEVRVYYVYNDAPPVFVVWDRFTILSAASVPKPPLLAGKSSWGRIRWGFR